MRQPDHIEPRERNWNITQEAKQCSHRAQVALEALIYGYSDELTSIEIKALLQAKATVQAVVARLRVSK